MGEDNATMQVFASVGFLLLTSSQNGATGAEGFTPAVEVTRDVFEPLPQLGDAPQKPEWVDPPPTPAPIVYSEGGYRGGSSDSVLRDVDFLDR